MTKKTTRFAPPIVSEFLREASPEQVDWYLSQGEPQCLAGNFLVDGDFAEKLMPGLRGIIVGKPVKTVEEAIAKAAEVKANAMARNREPFDEAAAGIDDEARDLQEAFDADLIRIESIAHIGTMQDGSLSDPLEVILDELDLDYPVAALDDLPFIRAALEGEERDELNKPEDLVQLMRDHGTVGFLIEASVPKMTPHGEGGYSIHYGSRFTNVFYGSTYAIACQKAVIWAKAKKDEMKAKAA